MPTTLEPEGERLLKYLTDRASTIDLNNFDTFPTYSGTLAALDLDDIGRTPGQSLDIQGMSNLAYWVFDRGLPAITGFIIDKTEKRPGKGYFDLYSKDADLDGAWWLSELAKAKSFPWRQSVQANIAVVHPAPICKTELSPTASRKVVHTVRDLAQTNSRFFLKSEWGPISSEWPALSFSKRSVGDYLNEEYNPSRDFIVYAGTGNADRTKVAEFRKRLLSVLITEPSQPIPTEDIVPWESWQRALTDHGKVWPLSFGVRRAWGCTDLPWAHDVTPEAYRSLGFRSNWGGVVEVVGDERNALLSLALHEVELPNRTVVQRVSNERDRLREIKDDRTLNIALTRMEALIKARLGNGRTVTRQLPARALPAGTNLFMLLDRKLQSQGGLCLLCGQILRLDTTKKLLQCSPDRIDSSNPSYGDDNLQITHLACNLAKNDATAEEFEEWLQLVRGGQEDED
jgi:hypothetical protein